MAAPSEEIEMKRLNELLLSEGSSLGKLRKKPSIETLSDEHCAPQDDHVDRPSIRGPYRPIRNGNIRGSIFAMLASVLGTGNLNLPLRVQQLGLIPFLIIICLTCALSYFGMYLMSRVIVKFKVVSYSEMVRKAFGVRVMKLSESILIIYPWAYSISLQVILNKFIMQTLNDLIGFELYYDRESEIYNQLGHLTRITMACLVVLLNKGNFFNTDLRKMLQSLGKFSVAGCLFNMVVIVLTAIIGFTKNYQGEIIQYQGIFNMSYQSVQFFKPISFRYLSVLCQGVAGIFYPFLNHQFIFPLISHLKRPTLKRVTEIFRTAHIQELLIYTIIGTFGYLLLSEHENKIPIAPLVITNISIAPLIVGKLTLIVVLFLALPLQTFTAREYIYEALDLERNHKNLATITYFYMFSTLIMSIIFTKVNMYFAVIGGTLGVMMAHGIPGLCVYKLLPLKSYDQNVLIYSIVISVFCVAGALLSIIDPA